MRSLIGRSTIERLTKRNRTHLRPIARSSIADALFLDGCLLDVIELREVLVQVSVSFRREGALIRPLAVLARDLLDNVHPRHDFAERREALRVEERVVLEVDED